MFDAFEILHFRRTASRSPPTFLQMCWCAATKRNFVGRGDAATLTPLEVESVDFLKLCDDIKNVLFSEESRVCFKLTLGSQLMYGSLRIYDYQMSSLEESVKKLMIDELYIGSEKGGKKKNPNLVVDKKTKNKSIDLVSESFAVEDIEDVDINQLFREDENRRDKNVIEEIDQFFKTDSFLNFDEGQSCSDVEKVMQELFEEMQRGEMRSRRVSQETPRANRTVTSGQGTPRANILEILNQESPKAIEILRQGAFKTPERFPLVPSSSSESAKAALTPPTSRRSESQLHTSVLGQEPPTEHLVDTPMLDSEMLPEVAATYNELPIFQSNIPAAVAPTLPVINTTDDNVEPVQMSQENFPVNQEAVEQVIAKPSIRGRPRLKNKKLLFDEEKQIEMKNVPADVNTRKTKVNIIEVMDKKKVPAQYLLKSPATSCAVGLRKCKTWSRRLADQFTDIIMSRERALRNLIPTEEPVAEELSRVEEQEIEHSPPKIMRTDEPTAIQSVIADNDFEMPSEVTVPVEKDVVMALDYLDPPINSPGQRQLDKIDFDAFSQIEDNIRDDTDAVNRPRRRSSKSSSSSLKEDQPKAKKTKVQERDGDAQSGDLMSKVKSGWDSVKSRRGRKNADKEVKVNFEEICHPDKYNAIDVINTLLHCFKLEKEEKMLIEQMKPYGALYLVKPRR